MSEVETLFQELLFGDFGIVTFFVVFSLMLLVGYHNKVMAMFTMLILVIFGILYQTSVDPSQLLFWMAFLCYIAPIFLIIRVFKKG